MILPDGQLTRVMLDLADRSAVVLECPIPDTLPANFHLLSEDEIQRGRRIRDPIRGHKWLCYRMLQRTILGQILNHAPQELRFEIQTHGKPRLQFPKVHLEFSVSHSHDLMVLALSKRFPVGVDVERIQTDRAVEELADRFFHPGESQWIKNGPDSISRVSRFHQVWVRKEAMLKALGTGIGTGPGTGLDAWCSIDDSGNWLNQMAFPDLESVVQVYPISMVNGDYTAALGTIKGPDSHAVESLQPPISHFINSWEADYER